MFRQISILLAMMTFLALLSPMSYTLAMICLLALPNILQQREEADHRRDAFGSTTASQSLHLAADRTIPGEVDHVEERQPIQVDPSAEPVDLSTGQDPLPEVVSAELETPPDQRHGKTVLDPSFLACHASTRSPTVAATPDLPTEEDSTSSKRDLPRSSGTDDSEEDDSDLRLPVKIERFLNDLTRKERAQIFECIRENYLQVLDQGYAEGCARGEIRLWYLQQRSEAQHTKVVSAMAARHVSDLKALKDMTAQCEDLSRQLEEHTAECQDLVYRNEQLSAQHIQIKRISELKQGKPKTISFARTMGKTPNRPKSPLAPQGEPSRSAAKGKGKMPVGANPGEADVRSLKTTPAKPEHEESWSGELSVPSNSAAKGKGRMPVGANAEEGEIRSLITTPAKPVQEESRPLAFPMPTRVRAPVDRLTKSTTPPDPSNASTTALTSRISASQSVLSPAPSTASSSLPLDPEAKALGNGATEARSTASPSAFSEPRASSSNSGPTTAPNTAEPSHPLISSPVPSKSIPTPAPSSGSSSFPLSPKAEVPRGRVTKAPVTVSSSASSKSSALSSNNGLTTARGTAKLIPSPNSSGTPTNSGPVIAPETALSAAGCESSASSTRTECAKASGTTPSLAISSANAGPTNSGPSAATDTASLSVPSTSAAGATNTGLITAPATAQSLPPAALHDNPVFTVNASHVDDLTARLESVKLEDEDQIDPYDVPLPATPVESVAGDDQEAPRANQPVGETSTLIDPEPIDPYEVPLPQTPTPSVDGDDQDPVTGTTRPTTDKPRDTFMTNSAFNGEYDRTTASHHRGTLDLKLEWCLKTTRRARRSLKKGTVFFSAHASTLLKLERKHRRFSNFMVKLPRLGEVPFVKEPTKPTRTRSMIVDRPDHSSRKWAHEQWVRRQYDMDWEC
ncbi:MAG: hypothetical protein LQ341_003383 [Variospora aurantia]|nr:MAG: hypothetical protein LQ341_003383 [Variospora aurantia]